MSIKNKILMLCTLFAVTNTCIAEKYCVNQEENEIIRIAWKNQMYIYDYRANGRMETESGTFTISRPDALLHFETPENTKLGIGHVSNNKKKIIFNNENNDPLIYDIDQCLEWPNVRNN
jgi:hypothetical protein